jgi:DinB superfamily
MPTPPSPEELTAAYRKKLLGFLGPREPLEVLGGTAEALARLAREHGQARMRVRPIEGKWTPSEVLGHLCDCEWVYGYRARLILSEPKPAIQVMNQDQWVAAQDPNGRDPLDLAEEFRALRMHNLRFWRNLGPQELERAGLHSERGLETLGQIRLLLAGHDLLHLDQMKRLLMAIV